MTDRRLTTGIGNAGLIAQKFAATPGLTPTGSVAVMLAIGDALALAPMEEKGVTRQDFGMRPDCCDPQCDHRPH